MCVYIYIMCVYIYIHIETHVSMLRPETSFRGSSATFPRWLHCWLVGWSGAQGDDQGHVAFIGFRVYGSYRGRNVSQKCPLAVLDMNLLS